MKGKDGEYEIHCESAKRLDKINAASDYFLVAKWIDGKLLPYGSQTFKGVNKALEFLDSIGGKVSVMSPYGGMK